MSAKENRPLVQSGAESLSTGTPYSTLRSQLKRRRDTAYRSVPLDCGCRDPWICKCTQPPLTDAALDGWRAAAEHVLACGHMPLTPLEVRRALYRRPADRDLAIRLHEGCGGAVA